MLTCKDIRILSVYHLSRKTDTESLYANPSNTLTCKDTRTLFVFQISRITNTESLCTKPLEYFNM